MDQYFCSTDASYPFDSLSFFVDVSFLDFLLVVSAFEDDLFLEGCVEGGKY